MAIQSRYARYSFRDRTGYLVGPSLPETAGQPVTIRHSAAVPPWADGDIHLHGHSEEYYFVFRGELHLLVAGAPLTLRADEALLIRPGVPHAVTGGTGPIEHFVLRVPAADDRRSLESRPAALPPGPDAGPRALQHEWGCRVPLADAHYQNCWLFGVGQARFHTQRLCLAYLDFPDAQSYAANPHPHRLHLHRASWEYYAVLQGTKTLRIEDELVEVGAGEILVVPPQARHVVHATATPLKGLTFRTPLLNDKVEF